MAKPIGFSGAARTDTADLGVADLIATIERLGHHDQDRMLKIVVLLADAPRTVQKAVHEMLRRVLETPPQTAMDCIAEVDAVIDYLEASGAPKDSSWSTYCPTPAGSVSRCN